MPQNTPKTSPTYNYGVVITPRHDLAATRAESDRAYPVGMTLKNFQNLAGSEVPNLRSERTMVRFGPKTPNTTPTYPHGVVKAPGNDLAATRADSDRAHIICMTLKNVQDFAGSEVPNLSSERTVMRFAPNNTQSIANVPSRCCPCSQKRSCCHKG